jgi:DNA-binding HxlR family transcriptional regulator
MNDRTGPAPAATSTVFIGKWTVEILSLLKERPHRHGELRRRLQNISQRMLTKTLRNLESGGLITRRVTQSKPLAVEYSLTKLGTTFLVPLGSICRWANRYDKDLSAAIQLLELSREPPL